MTQNKCPNCGRDDKPVPLKDGMFRCTQCWSVWLPDSKKCKTCDGVILPKEKHECSTLDGLSLHKCVDVKTEEQV